MAANISRDTSRVDDSEVESTEAESPFVLRGLQMLMKKETKAGVAAQNKTQTQSMHSEMLSPVIARISPGQFGKDQLHQSDAATLSPASEVLCPLNLPTQPSAIEMDITNLNDSQTTIDVSELPGHKDRCAIRKTVSLASTIDVGRIDEKRPATYSPIRKHEEVADSQTQIEESQSILQPSVTTQLASESHKATQKARPVFSEAITETQETSSTQSSNSDKRHLKDVRRKHEEQMTELNAIEKQMSKVLWQFNIDKSKNNSDTLSDILKSSKPTLARLSKSLQEERVEVVKLLSGGSKLNKTLKHALKEQAKLLQQRQRRLCDLFALHQQLASASSLYSANDSEEQSEPKTCKTTKGTVDSAGEKIAESISRPPKAKKIKCDKITASQSTQHAVENHSKTTSNEYVTTTNKDNKPIRAFTQKKETPLSFAVKQDQKDLKLPIEPSRYVDSTKETFSSKLKEDSQPTCAELLKAKSQAKMLQRKDLSTEIGVESVETPVPPTATLEVVSKDKECVSSLKVPSTPKPAVLPDGRRQMPAAIAGFLSPGSSIDVTTLPVSRTALSQPKFDVKKPLNIPPTTSHTIKPVSIVKPPSQPIALQKKPSDSGLNTGVASASSEQYPPLKEMIALNIIGPGSNVLSLVSQSHTAYGSLTASGFIRGSGGELFRSPMAWCSALLTNHESAKHVIFNRRVAYGKVLYMGKPLSELLSNYKPVARPCEPPPHTLSKGLHQSGVQNSNMQTAISRVTPPATTPQNEVLDDLRKALDKCTVLLIDDRELVMSSCKTDAYFNSSEFLDSIDKW